MGKEPLLFGPQTHRLKQALDDLGFLSQRFVGQAVQRLAHNRLCPLAGVEAGIGVLEDELYFLAERAQVFVLGLQYIFIA